MIREATTKLIEKRDLAFDEASAVMDEIMSGGASEVQCAGFLTALAAKGETIEEVTACASVMREHSLAVKNNLELLDIVGTGGDMAGTFNISTVSAFVAAGAGVLVAKHGNRAASSKCGAADVLEALGANIDLSPEQCRSLLAETGICFFFAPKYHASMRYVAPVRKELGIRTIFNLLGPLTNPASPTLQVMGVFSGELVEPLARALSNLGVRRGMVVYGEDGQDEISMSSPTLVCEFNKGEFLTHTICPEDFGLATCAKEELSGGTPEDNAKIAKEVLAGERGARRDVVLLNAGAALYIAGRADTVSQGVKLAANTVDSGKAEEKLAAFVKKSNQDAK